MIGPLPRTAAGRIPAVFAISLLLLLSACSQYGPMNRKEVALDSKLADKITVENVKFGVLVRRDDAISLIGPGGEELSECRPPATKDDLKRAPRYDPDLKICPVFTGPDVMGREGRGVVVREINNLSISAVRFDVNPHNCIVLTFGYPPKYRTYCPPHN